MPRNSQQLIQSVVLLDGTGKTSINYSISPQDTDIAISHVPPGIPSVAVRLPAEANDGDSYTIGDLDGTCSPGNVIAIFVTNPQHTIRGQPLIALENAFAGVTVTFVARARAWLAVGTGILGGQGAASWVNNAALVALNDTNVDVVTFVDFLPTTTGKLEVICTAVASLQGETGANITIGVNHGNPAPAAYDFAADTVFLNPNDTLAVSVRLDLLPVPLIFPVGAVVRVNGCAQASIASALQFSAHAYQMIVREVNA